MSAAPTDLPSTRRLLRATAIAVALAAVLLVTTVLPAEFGIDPTGLGARLGLDALAQTTGEAPATAGPPAAAVEAAAFASTTAPPAPPPLDITSPAGAGNAEEAAKALQAFGASPGQTFNAAAARQRLSTYRPETMTVTLAPGKGVEIKAPMNNGDGMVFRWRSSAPVAVDMHGDRTGAAQDVYTSYWIEAAQAQGSGNFTAPFDGNHGWYWVNRGATPATITLEVAGFQQALFRPGHD